MSGELDEKGLVEALAAMRAERDEAYGFMMDARQTADIFEAQVQRLTEENEALRNMAEGYGKLDADYAIAERRAEAAEARIKALEEALRPFGVIAGDYSDAEDDDFQVWTDFDVLGSSLPLRIFRAARSALKENAL